MALQIRSRTYRGVSGCAIVGTSPRGQRVSIFCRTEETARAIVQAVKVGDHAEVDRLLREECAA